MTDFIKAIFENYEVWLAAITGVVTAATAITALTPSRSDDVIIGKVLWVLNLLAGNIGRNRNADDT